MDKSRLAAIVIDCLPDKFEESVSFWAAALGVPAPARTSDHPRYVHLERPEGEIEVLIQRVEQDPGIHLDMSVRSLEEEVARLEAAGARRKYKVKNWWVMQDPSGHAFCVVPQQM
jgi:hypothetical protein